MFNTDESTFAIDAYHPEFEPWWPPQLKPSPDSFEMTVIEDHTGSKMWTEAGTLAQWRNRILHAGADTKEDLLWVKGAEFGEAKSERGSLRYNDNVVALTAIVVEHDAETIPFDKAFATLKKAKLSALLYTSPSYKKKTKERWRIVLPLSQRVDQDVEAQHTALVARVNGLFKRALAEESFALSQAYFFGRVGDNPDHRCEIVQGDYLDQRTNLDAGRIFKDGGSEPPLLRDRKKAKPLEGRNDFQNIEPADIEEVCFALSKVDADDYLIWMRVGAALADEYGEQGRDVFHKWSATSIKYQESHCDEKFNDFAELKEHHIATVFYLADEAAPGWRDEFKAKPRSEDDDSKPGKGPKFQLVALDDITMSPEPIFLIEELIPAGPALVVFGGPPKKGKTFAAIDALLHVAMGEDFLGLKVQQGAVVYVTSEGVRGFQHRMVAARKHHKIEGKNVPFYTVNVMPNLGSKADDAKKLIEDIEAAVPESVNVAAVVIDTLSRAIPGKSDKEGMDMSEFIENCDIIARELQCTCCVVHHAPRADEGRLRGANQLDGALDALIMVSRDEDTKVSTATVTAAKDFEDGMSWQYQVEPMDIREPVQAVSGDQKAHGFRTVRVGVAHGLDKASREDRGARSNEAKTVRLPDKQSRLHRVICDQIIERGVKLPKSKDVPAGVIAITRDELKLALKNKGYFAEGITENAMRARMSEALNALAGKNIIGMDEKHIWSTIID